MKQSPSQSLSFLSAYHALVIEGMGGGDPNHRRDDLIGQHHRVLCKDDYARSEQYIKFWRELAIGRKQEDRFLNLTGDGREVWLNAQYLLVLSDKNLVKRVLVLIHPA